MVEPDNFKISIARQCELLGISRSSYYYTPRPESPENLEIMRKIDEQYLKTPYYGVRKIHTFLQLQGYNINIKRVRRLCRLMGLEAVYPKPKNNRQTAEHKIYPYLLKGFDIHRQNQVWSSDITYIPMRSGFLYLTAVIDWFSRYILSWKISNSLDTSFCLEALNEALKLGKPEIFNTDQGVQFTSNSFTEKLLANEIKVSMDGKGRALDNIFIERFWRSLKYEYVYLNAPETGQELYQGLNEYIYFYNNERFHQSLNYQVPRAIHFKNYEKIN